MALRPVHVLLLLLPLCAYLFYRAAATEAKVHSLEQRFEGLDRPLAAGGATPPQAGAYATGSGQPGGAATSEVAGLQQEVSALKAELAQVRATQAEVGTPDAILGVVEEEQHRVQNLMVDFHAERWHEAADEVLEFLVKHANLSDFQRKRVGGAMTAEVERLAEIARTPNVFEDPDKLATDVIQLIDETDTKVLGVLNPSQRAAWQRHRAHERKSTYPWLPR